MSESSEVRLPEVMVFVGPNGNGKVARVNERKALEGHGVPEDKIQIP